MQKFLSALIACLCTFLALQGCVPAPTPTPLPTPIPTPPPTPTPTIIAWSEPDAILTTAEGKVEVRKVGEKDLQRVTVGHVLFNGDVVKTYEVSTATFFCTDFGLTESIGPSHQITVTCPTIPPTMTADDAWKSTLGTNLIRMSSGKPIEIGPIFYVPGDLDLLEKEIMQLGLDESSTRLLLANLYLSKGLWDDAANELEYLADFSPQPLFYQKLGDLYLLTEPPQYDKSEKLFLEALHLANEMGDKERIASADFGLGWFYFVRGERPKAAQYLRDSYDLYKELGLIEDADTVWSTMIKYDLEVP